VVPSESVTQRELAFAPQLYDRAELQFLRSHLPVGGTFVDVGAHIGAYAFVGAKAVGPTGKVLAIEAFEPTFRRLQDCLKRNALTNTQALCVGVSDREESVPMSVHEGNTGGNSLAPSSQGPTIRCVPLLTLVEQASLQRIDVLKLDIEGWDRRVVTRFFKDAPAHLRPKHAIVEVNPSKDADGDPTEVFLSYGYTIRQRTGLNRMLSLSGT
jgi:FkbM family methyltransferase